MEEKTSFQLIYICINLIIYILYNALDKDKINKTDYKTRALYLYKEVEEKIACFVMFCNWNQKLNQHSFELFERNE